MLLSQMLISMACSNVNTWENHQDVCNRFMEQSSKALQIQQGDQKIEDYFTLQAKNDANAYLGPNVEKAGGGVYYTYKVYKNRAIDFKLPTMGFCDSASNHITTNSYSLNLSWKMPFFK